MAEISGATELNNRQRFKGFFRTDSSNEFVGAALAEIARQFRWTQMAIITQGESIFLMVCGRFLGVCDIVLTFLHIIIILNY